MFSFNTLPDCMAFPGPLSRVFTSSLWQELFKGWKTTLVTSTAYHPQTDGQTERMNQCLEMYLRCAVHDCPKKWFSWLPLAEFWYNTSYHTSLDCFPFKPLYGTEPNYGMIHDLSQVSNTEVADMFKEQEQYSEFLKSKLQKAQHRMKQFAYQHRSFRGFRLVIRYIWNFSLMHSHRLWIGLFQNWHTSSLVILRSWLAFVHQHTSFSYSREVSSTLFFTFLNWSGIY